MIATAEPSTNGNTNAAAPSAAGVNGDGTPSANGRGHDGRFLPGNSIARGNPYHRATAARRKGLLEAVSVEDVMEVGRKLVGMAKEGDLHAAELLFKYVIGLPQRAANPDEDDLNELAILRQCPTHEEARHDLCRVKAAFAVALIAASQIGDEVTFDKARIFQLRNLLDFCNLGRGEGELLFEELDALERKLKGARKRAKNAEIRDIQWGDDDQSGQPGTATATPSNPSGPSNGDPVLGEVQ
jgi:hypothetical protein